MAFTTDLMVYPYKEITHQGFAIMMDHLFDVQTGTGILHGCALGKTGTNTVTLTAGWVMVRGRVIKVNAGSEVISPPSSGSITRYLVLTLDLSNSGSPTSISVMNSVPNDSANFNINDSGKAYLNFGRIVVSIVDRVVSITVYPTSNARTKDSIDFFPTITKLGSIPHGTGWGFQGLATNGTNLYALADNDNRIRLYTFTPSSIPSTDNGVTLSNIYGHPNTATYYNGYLYITGAESTNQSTNYAKIGKYSISSQAVSFINSPTVNSSGVSATWAFEIGKTYSNKLVVLSHRSYSDLIDVYATIYGTSTNAAGLNKFLPWQTLNLGPFACDPAGMCVYDKFILIGDAHLGGSFASNRIRVFTTDGDHKTDIYLGTVVGDHEIEDICTIGDILYLLDIDGNVYSMNISALRTRNYDTGAFIEEGAYGLKYAYINENGSETYTTLSNGEKFLSSFRTVPSFRANFNSAVDTSLVMPGAVIKGVHNQSTGKLTFDGVIKTNDGTFGLARVRFEYSRSLPSDGNEYLYTLTHVYGIGMRANSIGGTGVMEEYDSLEDLVTNGAYIRYDSTSPTCFIRDIKYEVCPKYTWTTFSL